MSFFGSILSKLGINSAEAAPVTAPITPTVADVPVEVVIPEEPVAPAAIAVVDVMAQLEALSASHGNKLNWKSSIVDLLKLLGLDSSFSVRKELAVELGCPAEKMADSALMNVWLHKTVLQKIAENGGNVPADLLD